MTGETVLTEISAPNTIDHIAVFSSISNLVGDWSGTNEEGHPVSVRYTMTANNTAVVEQWYFHKDMEALTIYHLDGDQLMAMHYCPIGNQPRLDLKRQLKDGTLEFEFSAATNLTTPNEPHEHAFNLRIIDDETVRRNETYVENGVAETNGTTFHRGQLHIEAGADN